MSNTQLRRGSTLPLVNSVLVPTQSEKMPHTTLMHQTIVSQPDRNEAEEPIGSSHLKLWVEAGQEKGLSHLDLRVEAVQHKGLSHLDLRVEAVQHKGLSHLDLRVEAVKHIIQNQLWTCFDPTLAIQYNTICFSYSHEILIGVRLKMLRRSSVIQNNFSNLLCKFTLCISYDTSFLNRNQVVVDGDVESNPGPVSSVDLYRAGIGKCSRKAPCKNITPHHEKWIEMTLLFCSFAVLYALIINIMIFYFIHFMAFTIVVVIYGYSYWIIWHGSFLFSMKMKALAKRRALMRKPSLLKDSKGNSLVPCNYLNTFVIDGRLKYSDTYVLDGRDWKTQLPKIDHEKLYIMMERVFKFITNMISYLVLFLLVCYRLKLNCRMLHGNNLNGFRNDYSPNISNGINQQYSVNHLKLLQLLIDGDIESNPGPSYETPKGKGRKAKNKSFNFMKPKCLNFNTNEVNKFRENPDIISLNDVQTWHQMNSTRPTHETVYQAKPEINTKISLVQGNIVNIKADAIVNAAKTNLLGGGGIDGAIHKAAGVELKRKCELIPPQTESGIRCHPGQCKVTDTVGCNLNCDFVFHTVGPNVECNDLMDYYSSLLLSCYENCLLNVTEHNVKSIVFPCISTGIFKFDNQKAAEIALGVIRSWLEVNHNTIERIILCTYEDKDFTIYHKLMCEYFPVIAYTSMEKEIRLPSERNEKCNSHVLEEIPSESTIVDQIIHNFPAKLENVGVNICFFNSILQCLHVLHPIHIFLQQTLCSNPIIDGLKILFSEMEHGNGSIKTADYIHQFNLRNYRYGTQHDAHEALNQILDECFPDNTSSISHIKINESIVCKIDLGGCGSSSDNYESHQILKLFVDETNQMQSVESILNTTFDFDRIEEYKCDLDPGKCQKVGSCNTISLVSELSDVLIIQLKIFRREDHERKIFPGIHVNQEIIQFHNYTLKGIIWHHGQNIQSGHYTSMIKHNGIWHHMSDSSINDYPIRFSCTAGELSVPYLLFYEKTSCNLLNSVQSNESNEDDQGLIDFETSNPPKKFNFGKRKSRFASGKAQKMAKIRATPEGRADYNESQRLQMKKDCATPEGRAYYNESKRLLIERYRATPKGRAKHNESERSRNEKYRGTPEGRDKHNESERSRNEKYRGTPEGRDNYNESQRIMQEKLRARPEVRIKYNESHRRCQQNVRSNVKSNLKEQLENDTFPPIIKEDHKITCLQNFINATSPAALSTYECAVCRELVSKYDMFLPGDLPNANLISVEESDEVNLDEYIVDNLLLSRGGIASDGKIRCCKSCLNYLQKNKLPPLSIANNFQIGKAPPELSDLTLPEKLLISVYRPKIHVVKLRSCNGPGTRQSGLKGNTITFPQDIVKIAACLPANPDIFADHLKVVFLGKSRPTREMLKKVFTVRREKVYNAVRFLINNHPLYADVTLSNVNLPVDDIPEQILQTLEEDDLNNEDENEHSTYTPQTDVDDIPDDTVLMNATGMIDMEGSSVRTSDQMDSAIQTLQGTLYVPHGSVPLTEYNNPDLWTGAYPWLFPYGRGGPETNRKVPVSLKAYIKHLLLLADRTFGQDSALPFHAFNVLQKRDVSLHTSILVKRTGFRSTAAQISSLNQEAMDNLIQSVQNKTRITDPNVRALMKTLSTTGAHIKGSPYQKKAYRREIFGLMIKYGTPVLWITISPAAAHSPIFIQIAGHEVDFSNIPSHVERARMVANDPVSAAIYFNKVIDAFTEHILGYKKVSGGIFGYPAAFYGMTEEQGTGTLHNHMLVWLQGFKSATQLKEDIEDDTFKESLKKYLDDIIKQGFLGTDEFNEDLNVSEVSCKYPVQPSNNVDEFKNELNDDVNKLVKVCNTHSCRETCYKNRSKKQCRFGYPRELVPETTIDEGIIKLKRTSESINNFNPIMMTAVRSNHDIKFIPSGKDGKNVAFYVTDYATKSQLSTHQMVPLIVASKKRVDEVNANDSTLRRSHLTITKCLNSITTTTEISGSHVCHFELGHLDKKTSHSFIQLNLHSALRWLSKEIERFNDANENSSNEEIENDEENNVDRDDNMFHVSLGNNGYVLVNQIIDYVNRGTDLAHMCLYEYCSKIKKAKFSEEDEEKANIQKNREKRTVGRPSQPRYRYSNNHPQSETHWQVLRADENDLVPALSMLPPSRENNSEKFIKCMLLLFKPFSCLDDLFDGNSWEDSYDATDFNCYYKYIENIQEMHIGLQEKSENRLNDAENDVNEDIIVNEESDDFVDTDATQVTEEELDGQTIDALNIIQNTGWLEESTSDIPSVPLSICHRQMSHMNNWEKDIKRQNRQKRDQESDDENEVEELDIDGPTFIEPTIQTNDAEVGYTVNPSDEMDYDEIASTIIERYSLNRKQKVAFQTGIKNVIKRAREEETTQVIGYVGGPGGTGKSQVIKAIVDFHKEIKRRHTLKLTAYTGTASKHIGGSTTATLFSYNSPGMSDLEKRFENVETIIVDEVSMIGCRQLARISEKLTRAKHANPTLPFGGVDIIFFGDFIQFPPIKDAPLYSGWANWGRRNVGIAKSNSDIRKQCGIEFWRQLNHIILLDQQMRVTDEEYQGLLNRLRQGKCTDEDVEILNRRVVGQTVNVDRISSNPIISPGNKLVMEINRLFSSQHSQGKQVFVSKSTDYLGQGKKQLPSDLVSIIKDFPSTRTDGLPRELPLFIGMPVFLTKNIAVELGLTNGSTGIIKSIHFKQGEVIPDDAGYYHLQENPDYIVVEMDDISMRQLNGLEPNHVPIFPHKGKKFEVMYHKKEVSIKRTHFPLVPRFSCTAHKSQGQTLSKAIIDLVPPIGVKKIEINHAYVPLSRVRRLNDLTILRPFDPSILKAKVNEDCAAMMKEFEARDLCKDL